MGLLDDALRQLTQGNQTQPGLSEVLQDLLQGKVPASGGQQQQAQVPQPQAANPGEAGGLADLIAKLEAGGLGDQVKSWIGNGQNAPVAPQDLGSALGKNTVSNMADKAGVPEDDLLTQLAKALPGIIDKLTSDGRGGPTQRTG